MSGTKEKSSITGVTSKWEKILTRTGKWLMDVSLFVMGFSIAGQEHTIQWAALITGVIGRGLTIIFGKDE